LARALRIDHAGAWHHVMNRGAGRRLVFRTKRHRAAFLDLLGDLCETYRVAMHAYCLMPNHYHLLIQTPEGGLSRAMRHLDGVYTQRFNRLSRTDGSLFRGRFRSVLVDADAYLLQVSRYIHRNPVDAGLVQRAEQYEWSSYRHYLRDRGGPRWLETSFILGQFGEADQASRYRAFVESDGDAEVDRFYESPSPGPVLGRRAFRDEIDRRLDVSAASREVPARDRVRAKPRFESILRAVAQTFQSAEADLVRRDPTRAPGGGLARGAVVHLSRRTAGYAMSEIAQRLGYDSYAGASSAMRRVETEMRRHSALRRRMQRARELLHQNET
jgi:REP element-mobilizing transposase RayT